MTETDRSPGAAPEPRPEPSRDQSPDQSPEPGPDAPACPPPGAAAWKPLRAGPFIDAIGPILRARDAAGAAVYGFASAARHANALGSVHGGALTSVLDQALAVEAWNAAGRAPTVTLQMDTRFIAAARAGDCVRIRHRARGMIFLDADLSAGTTLIATATAVMKILSSKGR